MNTWVNMLAIHSTNIQGQGLHGYLEIVQGVIDTKTTAQKEGSNSHNKVSTSSASSAARHLQRLRQDEELSSVSEDVSTDIITRKRKTPSNYLREEPEYRVRQYAKPRKIQSTCALDSPLQMEDSLTIVPTPDSPMYTTPPYTEPNDSDRWFTPKEVVLAVQQALSDRCFGSSTGSIELDPCSEKEANKLIKANHFFSTQSNPGALTRDWKANTMFINPPFSNIATWMNKLHSEISSNNLKAAIALVPATRCNEKWYNTFIALYPYAVMKSFLKFTRPKRVQEEMIHHASSCKFPSVAILLHGFSANSPTLKQAFASFKKAFDQMAYVYAPANLLE